MVLDVKSAPEATKVNISPAAAKATAMAITRFLCNKFYSPLNIPSRIQTINISVQVRRTNTKYYETAYARTIRELAGEGDEQGIKILD